MLRLPLFVLLVSVLLFTGCSGGSGGGGNPPANPSFTSKPQVAASEGSPYSYAVTATSPDSSAITFTLTTAPAGATLSGNSISWTPTHAESRVSNSFIVTAQTAAGGSATQSWTVTPTGNVNITAVITFWTSSGTSSEIVKWAANLPYPAALVPQADGTLQRFTGSTNADGSFTIPNVPGGYYWLQINPSSNYWTSTGDFDYGEDLIGRPLNATAQSTTTFNSTVTGLVPPANFGDYFLALTDLRTSFSPASGTVFPMSSTFTSSMSIQTDIDWSLITTLYLSQYQHIAIGNFAGMVLGPSQTISNVSFTNGATNTITGTLSAGNPVSLPLNIAGSAWANLTASMGPGSPTPAVSDFAAFVEPYVTGRSATSNSTPQIGPEFTLLRPTFFPGLIGLTPPYACGIAISATTLPGFGNPPIVTDTDYGTISYNDPYPATWQRNFQYCQLADVTLPRPNSSATDTFSVGTSQITPLPSGPVTPIVSSVQSPMLNGASLFTPATLSTTNVTINWSAPAIGQPFGYFVTVYQLLTGTTGISSYGAVGTYATTKTSVNVPFLSANNVYVFSVVAMVDTIANLELAPLRRQVPTGRSGVVSAPFVIAAGATP